MEKKNDSETKLQARRIKDAPWDSNAYEVVGYRELTEEEKEQGRQDLLRIMKEFGEDTTGLEDF